MTIETGEFLQRISGTLRNDVGPAVGDEFTRTQAYMASVILAKLAKQVQLAPAHGVAEEADLAELRDRLAPVIDGGPDEVIDATANATTIAALGPLIESLYRWGIDRPAAADALALVRVTLRRDIDRRMEIAS